MPRARSPRRGISPIRRLVYWLGFRPRRHSPFFSPSLDMQINGRAYASGFRDGLNKTLGIHSPSGHFSGRCWCQDGTINTQTTNPTDAASAAPSDTEGPDHGHR